MAACGRDGSAARDGGVQLGGRGGGWRRLRRTGVAGWRGPQSRGGRRRRLGPGKAREATAGTAVTPRLPGRAEGHEDGSSRTAGWRPWSELNSGGSWIHPSDCLLAAKKYLGELLLRARSGCRAVFTHKVRKGEGRTQGPGPGKVTLYLTSLTAFETLQGWAVCMGPC